MGQLYIVALCQESDHLFECHGFASRAARFDQGLGFDDDDSIQVTAPLHVISMSRVVLEQ